jgi:integrase
VFEAPLAGDSEEIVEHRAANAQATDVLSRMHRLQLHVLIIKPLERADRDQLPAAADTEEGDGGIEQAIDLERVRILWRAVQTPELQMMLDELSHVIDPWISDRDVELIHQHAAILTARLAATSRCLVKVSGVGNWVDGLAERFAAAHRAAGYRTYRSSLSARVPIAYLRELGVVGSRSAAAASGPVEELPADLRVFLERERGLAAEAVAGMLASCDSDSVIGRRDRAVLLLLLRLGLRRGEVAGIGLEDIDWRAGAAGAWQGSSAGPNAAARRRR